MSAVDPDALGLIELDGLARGWRALDAMVKESPVRVLGANLVEPGKFLILFGGGVEEVERAQARGLEVGADAVIDRLVLPFAHPRVWACLRGEELAGDVDCLGVLEGRTVAATLEAADAAAKGADVTLVALRVTPALGGRGWFAVTGAQTDVEAAVSIGVRRVGPRVHRAEVIPAAHPEMLAHVLVAAPFGAR